MLSRQELFCKTKCEAIEFIFAANSNRWYNLSSRRHIANLVQMENNTDFNILKIAINKSLDEFYPKDDYERAYFKEHAHSFQEVEKKILENGEPSLSFEEMTGKWAEIIGGIHSYRIGFLKLRFNKDGKLEQMFSNEAKKILTEIVSKMKKSEDVSDLADFGSDSLNPHKKSDNDDKNVN